MQHEHIFQKAQQECFMFMKMYVCKFKIWRTLIKIKRIIWQIPTYRVTYVLQCLGTGTGTYLP